MTENSGKILIVDDEETACTVFARWLTKEGYVCETATSGQAAFDILVENTFSLVVLDIMMPEISGIDVLDHIVRKYENTAVIMVTAIDDHRVARRTIKWGAYGYLIKPFERNELLVNVLNALHRREIEIENRQHREKLEERVAERTKEIEQHKKMIEDALNQLSGLISKVIVEKKFDVRFPIQKLQECYLTMNCKEKDCPCYGQEKTRCWQIAGTFCGGEVQSVTSQKYGTCLKCPVYKEATSDYTLEIGEHFNNMMHILSMEHDKLGDAYHQLKMSQAQIVQQEKMASIGQLSAGIAHEINNPVGYISSNLGSLAKYISKLTDFINSQATALDTCEGKEDINELRKKLKIDFILEDISGLIKESAEGCDRVKSIVLDLKSFSRADQDKAERADLNEHINKTLNVVWNELKYKAEVKKELGDIPSTVCHPQKLNQVFMNLLVNASHAIAERGEIGIKTWHEKDSIYVSISDTGSGISKENLPKLFEPFFTTKEAGKGTGLGLSISYDIIRKHNGEITVDSEEGKGTTFTVRIPVIE
jgi:signal transduction histidine kinase/CheY-like chemotaxis protein